MDIITETVNRIRVTDGEIILLYNILSKIDTSLLEKEELRLHKILLGRLEGRMKLKENNNDV